MLDQLRILSTSVEQLTQAQKQSYSMSASGDGKDDLLEEVRTMRQQIADMHSTQAEATQLTAKVIALEAALNEKTILCEKLSESHQRLSAQLSEERDRREQLDRKLEAEKRAAAQVRKCFLKISH